MRGGRGRAEGQFGQEGQKKELPGMDQRISSLPRISVFIFEFAFHPINLLLLSLLSSPKTLLGYITSNSLTKTKNPSIINLSNKNKKSLKMAELTGLDSILEKSHYKTQRRHKYSFGKSQRFPQLKSTYTIDYYNQPVPRDTRTCSFGYGSKYFFNKPPNNPTALEYNLPNEKKMGISFGVGRQQAQNGDYLKNSIKNTTKAGFKYNPNINSTSKFRGSPKCSMSNKTDLDSFIKPNFNPEASKYDTSIEKDGRVTLSTFKSTKNAVFAKSERIMHSLQKSLVGPGDYNVNDHFNSKKKKPVRNVFAMAAKKSIADDAIKRSASPGPIYYVA